MLKNNELIMTYLDCHNPDEKAKLYTQILHSGTTAAELAELEQFYQRMDDAAVPEFSDNINTAFYRELAQVKATTFKSSKSIWQLFLPTPQWKLAAALVYSILLVMVSYHVGKQPEKPSAYDQELLSMSSEIQEMKSVMAMTLLTQTSAAQRIQGISTINSMQHIDSMMMYTLLQTLFSDPDDNVRLVALQTLSHYRDEPIVRQGLVHAISSQDSPVILVTLADIMMSMQEKASVEPFQRALNQVNLDASSREKIAKSILALI